MSLNTEHLNYFWDRKHEMSTREILHYLYQNIPNKNRLFQTLSRGHTKDTTLLICLELYKSQKSTNTFGMKFFPDKAAEILLSPSLHRYGCA